MSEAIASAIMAPDRPPLEPRCIPITEAAAYCGLTPSGFRHWVAIGRLPGALPGTRRWDRRAIDVALDRLSGLPVSGTPEPEENDFDRWKRAYDAREAAAKDPNLRGPSWRRVPR